MGVMDLALGVIFYQSLPCGIGITAYRSYREAPQAPVTTTSIIDVHLYGVTVIASGPRYHPTKIFPLLRHLRASPPAE
jgi:hypothetical protein